MSATIDPYDASSWVLSDEGMGPFVLGMPFADAIVAVPGMEDACGRACSRTDDLWIGRSPHPDDPLGIAVWKGAAGPRTVDGLGVGSTTADVLAEYPDASVEFYHSYTLHAGNMFFQFEPNAGELGADGEFVDDGTPKAITGLAVTEDGPQFLWDFC